MADLVESSEFTEGVLRLDTETPVKGYDGKDLGPANEPAQALANRTKWLKEQTEALTEKVDSIGTNFAPVKHKHEPSDIETDENNRFVTDSQIAEWDEKLTPENAAKLYVAIKEGNKANGYLKLNEEGDIPFEFAKLFRSRYLAVADQAERLALDAAGDLTICLQNDENRIYYLNSGLDPKNSSAWLEGRKVQEYKADEIAETTTREFVSPDEKKTWNNKQDKLVSGTNIATVQGKSLVDNTSITLTASDVKADPEGTAKTLMDEHTASNNDPHPQYLLADAADGKYLSLEKAKSDYVSKTLAEETYVPLESANKEHGYLQLDANGMIPADLAAGFKAYYTTADDKAERLLIKGGTDLIICLQLDENIMYYLNPGLDGTVEDNWKKGRQNGTVVGGVSSVFGRVDAVVAKLGDYTTDLIKENTGTEKVFVSPSEKETWSGKQDKLKSTENISTVCGKDLLGGGDIILSSTDIKTTDSAQFVSTTEKEGWDSKQAKLTNDDFKTLNGESVLGKGAITIDADSIADADHQFVTSAEKATWNGKQDKLSNDNLKTINGESLIGKGDVTIDASAIEDDAHQFVTGDEKEEWSGKQDKLESGVNIRKLNGNDLLGSEELVLTTDTIKATDTNQYVTPDEKTTWSAKQNALSAEKIASWDNKQDKLTSGTNLATVFGKDLLAGGDVDIADAENLAKVLSEKLKAGDAIELKYDEESGVITVNNTAPGRAKPITVTLDNVIGGRGYRYRLNKIDISSDFKVYRYAPIFGDDTVIVDYDNPDVPLVVSELPVGDASGYFPNDHADVSIPLYDTTGSVELYTSDDITTSIVDEGTKAVRVYCENTLENVIPFFGSANTLENFTPFASNSFGNYLPWKAFQKPLTDGQLNPVPDTNAWSSADTWDQRVGDVYLAIKNVDRVKLTGYGFQNFSRFYYTAWSTAPTEWKFQGRDEDTEEWVTLDTRVDSNIMTGTTGWTTYRLAEPAYYKQYRVLVLDVVNRQNSRAVIPRLVLCNDVGILVKDKDGRYLTPDDYGDYKVVTVNNNNDFRNNCFNNPPKPLLMGLFEEIQPVKVCSLKNIPISVAQYDAVPAIALHYPIIDRVFWDGLKDVNPTEFYGDNSDDEIRYAATIDGKTYHIYNNGWESLGELTNDSASTTLLLEKGMESQPFTDITEEQWNELLTDSMDEPRIGVAYARYITAKNQPITPKTLEVEFDPVYGWQIQSFDKTKISFTEDFVLFNPTESGKYQFVYVAG